MLTMADFRRAIDKAPELRYIDRSWRKRKDYWIVEGEQGAYVCAPEMLAVQRLDSTDPDYTANEAYGGGPEEKLLEAVQEYFLWHSYCKPFSGTAEEEQKDFMKKFLRKADEAVDEAGEMRLRRWLREEHGELDEAAVEFLWGISAEAFDQIDEATEGWLNLLSREAVEGFRLGGQERMFTCLRKHFCPEVEERDLERLFESIRKDLGAGVSLAEALARVVSTDEHGSATPGSFTQNALSNSKQDAFKKFEGHLDELLEQQKNKPRSFYPLSSPGLFLEFAELGGKEITQEDVLGWVERYGILGLGLDEFAGDVKPYLFLGGPQESVAAFAREAKEANLTKRTYEAALRMDSPEDEIVAEAVKTLQGIFGWSKYSLPSPPECKEKAWNFVIDQVQSRLDEHCLVRWQRAGNGLVDFLEFKTIIGAMYLQFAWVLRERADVRRCKHCGKPIEGYRNKEFCNRTCKNRFRNQLKRRERNEENSSFSVTSATKEEVKTLAAMRGIDVDILLREMLQVYKEHDQAR